MKNKIEQIILYNPKSTRYGKVRFPTPLSRLPAVLEKLLDVRIVDGNIESDPLGKIIRYCRKRRSILAITVMPGRQVLEAVRHSNHIRNNSKQTPIIWGGFFPTFYSDWVMSSGFVDYVIRGQGEITLGILVKLLMDNNLDGLEAVEGLSYRKKEYIGHSPDRALTHMDSLPSIDFSCFDMEKYIQPSILGQKTIYYAASIGCHAQCSFCGIKKMYPQGNFSSESVETVVETLTYLKKRYHIDSVYFVDSDFFFNKIRLLKICDRLAKMKLKWRAYARADKIIKLEKRGIKRLVTSGCKRIFIGAESINESDMVKWKKNEKFSDVVQAVETCSRHDIGIDLSFIMGSPGETVAAVNRTIQFALEMKERFPLLDVILYIYSPLDYSNQLEPLREWVEKPENQKRMTWDSSIEKWQDKDVIRLVLGFRRVFYMYYGKAGDKKSLLDKLKYWIAYLPALLRIKNQWFDSPVELDAIDRIFHINRIE